MVKPWRDIKAQRYSVHRYACGCPWCGGIMRPLEPAATGTERTLAMWVYVCACGHELCFAATQQQWRAWLLRLLLARRWELIKLTHERWRLLRRLRARETSVYHSKLRRVEHLIDREAAGEPVELELAALANELLAYEKQRWPWLG